MSNARVDLPDPDKPVITMSLSRGSSSVIFFRLCYLAPLIFMFFTAAPSKFFFINLFFLFVLGFFGYEIMYIRRFFLEKIKSTIFFYIRVGYLYFFVYLNYALLSRGFLLYNLYSKYLYNK